MGRDNDVFHNVLCILDSCTNGVGNSTFRRASFLRGKTSETSSVLVDTLLMERNIALAQFVMDTFFIADVAINFRTGFYDTETSRNVYDQKQVAMRYLKGCERRVTSSKS
eukprot:SAG31_NODE_630_length_13427_cov_27.066327_12_plen_110_part_00